MEFSLELRSFRNEITNNINVVNGNAFMRPIKIKYFILISVNFCKNYNSLCKVIKIKECSRVNLSDEDLELVVEFSTTRSMIEGQEGPHLWH